MNEFDELLKQMLGPNYPAKAAADDDPESWLLAAGDNVVRKMATNEHEPLASSEHAIYCLWILDYAVRNSGTLEPMRDRHAAAASDLEAFAQSNNLNPLRDWAASAADETAFCATYHETFPTACAELRNHIVVAPG
jgi:hypothetical protein